MDTLFGGGGGNVKLIATIGYPPFHRHGTFGRVPGRLVSSSRDPMSGAMLVGGGG